MEEYDLKTYKYGPIADGDPKKLVILLHGLGSDGRDLISLAPLYAQSVPDAVFVSPDAPFPCDMAPMGYQWFSLMNRAPEAILAGAKKTAPILEHYIAAQMKEFGIPADKTALVGFSQGTMMSLYAAPRFPEKLAGVLAYSGALVGGDGLSGEGIQKIPVELIHGDMDTVVPVENYYYAESVLSEAGFPVSGGVVSGVEHNIDEHGVASGRAFLMKILN